MTPVLSGAALADTALVEAIYPRDLRTARDEDNGGPESQIRRAVANVVANAVKCILCGGYVTNTVSSTADLLTVDVSDSGPEMIDADLARAFDRCHRSNSAVAKVSPLPVLASESLATQLKRMMERLPS